MSDMSMQPLSWVPEGTERSPSGSSTPKVPGRPGKPGSPDNPDNPDKPPPGPALGEAFAWPSPPDGSYPPPERQTSPEPCELESLQGRVSTGALMLLNLDAAVALVRMGNNRRTVTLRFGQFRRLTLLKPLAPLPLAPDVTAPLLPRRGLTHCRLTFVDGFETAFTSIGHLDTPSGVFTFRPLDEHGTVERSFFPRTRLAHAAFGPREVRPLGPAMPRAPRALAPAEPPAAPQAPVTLSLAPRVDATALPVAAPLASVAPALTAAAAGAATAAASLSAAAPAANSAASSAANSATNTASDSPPPTDESRRALGDLSTQAPICTTEKLLEALDQQARMPMVRIGEALMALGCITEQKLGDALHAQSRDRSLPLGELLVRRGDVSRADLQTALARKMGYPIVDPHKFPVEPTAALRLPAALARRLTALPLLMRAGQLVVALEDPSARSAIDEIEFSAQCKVQTVLARAGTLAQAVERVYQRMGEEAIEPSDDLLYGLNNPDGEDMASKLLANLEQQGGDGRDDDPQIEQSDNSLVRLINSMIQEARTQGVSDIHIECPSGREKVRVRFRRDGVLKLYMELPHTYRNAMVARLKIMCDLDISERRKPQDGKINFGRWVQGQKLELRVATIPTANGLEDVVLRLLASAKSVPLEGMGLQPDTLARLKSVVERPYGLVLCVGPTGSGKTTTLHAALRHINTPERKIWTAEDPVEITQPGLRQVQVNPKIDWTFAKALRAFLRADPDVVMVGEIRDSETAQMAVEASLTGHLVLSTLHTNSAPETVTRLLDMGMDPFAFADSLLAVLAQRLVRRWCQHCSATTPASLEVTEALLDEYLQAYPEGAVRPERDDLRAEWLQRYGQDGHLPHHHAPGCAHCGESGYSGRLGLHELLMVSRELRRLIQTHARADELQRQAMAEGMRTLRQDGIHKVLAGLTSIEEVRATSNV